MSRFVLTAQLQLQAPSNVRQVVQQIQSQLQGVVVNVQVQNATQAQRQIQQVTQSTNQATTAAERMGRAFALSVRRFAAFSIATRGVGLFTSSLGDAVQSAIDFERQLIKVSQVTGKSVSQLRGLTKQISNLATNLGVASSDLLNVSTILAQAGLSAEDTAAALKTLAKAALAPNFDSMSETAEGAIAILAQFKEGVGALEKQLGSINAVAGAFAVEASDLIDVVRRTGGVFKSSGGNLNELLALFTSVRATTRESAESIGTGLRTIFTRIQRPKTIEYLKQFGVQLTDLNGKFVGPYEAVKRLSEALSGLSEGDITFIGIAEELGGFRQIGKVLPLLQQFSTAQSALNVAMKAGDSLTQDAASAQAALAIRVMKVKEEFLALIRSVTETSTFQVMANTALTLASALVKIGDAIKPLLPMLGALAAIRLVRGMGNFFGGIGQGITSGRTYNSGGKVLGFARGGLVPGSGNSDTVPAMLSPGEFVIRKSSVSKLGTSNLEAMNSNKYAAGGIAKWQDIKGKNPSLTDNQAQRIANGTLTLDRALSGPKKQGRDKLKTAYLKDNTVGGLFLQKGDGGTKGIDKILKGEEISGFPGVKRVKGNITTALLSDKPKSSLRAEIEPAIVRAVEAASVNTMKALEIPPLDIDEKKASQNAVKRIDVGSIEGHIFEAFISAMSGANISDTGAPFDFVNLNPQSRKKLKNIFDGSVEGRLLDAKRTQSSDSVVSGTNSISNKVISAMKDPRLLSRDDFIMKHFGGVIQKFSQGGTPELYHRGTTPYSIDDMKEAAKRNGMTFAQLKAMLDEREKGGWQDFIIPWNEVSKKFGLYPYQPGSPAMAAAVNAKINKEDRIDAWKKKQGMMTSEYEGQSKEQKMFLSRRRKFATGGGVGTDTIPALLTPGEFVINKSSAESIGYGNLNRMNKVGKYAKGGTVGKPQRLFVGGVAGKHIERVAGYRELTGVDDAVKTMESIVKGLGPAMKSAIMDSFAGIESVKGGDRTKFRGNKVSEDTRGQALFNNGATGMALQFKGKKAAANTNTIAHETGHLADYALGGKRKLTSKTQGTFQFDLVEKVKPQIESALKDAGYSAKQIKTYFASNAELFAEFFAKSSPAVRAIITSTTDSKVGMAKLAKHLNQVGHTFAGLQASDISVTPLSRKPTKASTIGMSTADVLAAAKAQSRGGTMPSGVGKSNPNPSSTGFSPLMGVSIASSMATQFLPALEDSSGSLVKLSHDILNLVTTVASVGFALESFGLKLSGGKMLDFFSGKGIAFKSSSMMKGLMDAGLSKGFATNITLATKALSTIVGPITAVVGALWIAKKTTDMFVEALFGNAQKRKEAAIQKGDISEAGKQAKIQSDRSTYGTGIFGGAAVGTILGGLVGGIVGAFGGPIGTAIGIKVGASVGTIIGGSLSAVFGGNFADEAATTAMAFAANSKASQDLAKAQNDAALASEKFKNGAISADEYLSKFSLSVNSINESRKYANDVVAQSTNNKSEYGSGKILRNLGAYLGGGLFGMETADTRNKRLSQEGVDVVKSQRENESKLFDSSTEARNAVIRNTIARGGSISDAQRKIKEQTGFDSEDMRRRASSLGLKAEKARQSGDVKLASELDAQSKGIFAQANQLEDSFINLEKEVKRQIDLYNALNLGLRSASATSSALSTVMGRFSSSLDVGGSQFVNEVQFLQESLSSAAQAIDQNDIKNAMKTVSTDLKNLGVGDQYISKFENNILAFTTAQQNYNKAFDNIKKSMAEKDFKGMSADSLKTEFANELTKDIPAEGAKALKATIMSLDLSDEDVNKVIAGDLSVFGDKLTEAQKKMLDDVQKIAQDRAKAEQVLIDFTKKRIESERNFVAAQQEAISLFMEGRDLQAKYGGTAVSNKEKRDAILAKSNIESGRLGLTNLNAGDAGDLRRRNAELRQNFAAIEGRRALSGGMSGISGVGADELQKDLDKAYKTQIETIRNLIRLEEEQLKITEEKNKLEKDSLESLVKGDIEEFFKKQASVGATAAIASGDKRLMRFYGADALGAASLDIKRQQEAGVQDLYGRKLAGVGGLAESSANAALSARGVTDMRAAQMMAGTTAGEEASKARLRELGGLLGETGQLGADMAEMQVNTATINVNSANIKFNETMERGNRAAQEALDIENKTAFKSRGGMIYASRGIFVPRGTDTVPAMLTPGEFVINRAAVQRGNNLQLLQAMNNGAGSVSNGSGAALMARGGVVRYRSGGSSDPEQPGNMSKFTTALENFNRDLAKNVESLKGITISIKLDSTNVNVNLNDGGLLKALTSQVKSELFGAIEKEFRVSEGGNLRRNTGIV
jgi:TP901 family phage tail tape measure protein